VACFAQKHFLTELLNSRSYKTQSYKLALEETFLRMDEMMEQEEGAAELLALAKEDGKQTCASGCTATTVLVTPKTIFCANAGDSRTVLSWHGMAEPMSSDHKPKVPQEKVRIEKAGAFIENDRIDGKLALSRALGDFKWKGND